ncbi:MAG: hypothetical protein JJT78_02200, partial [Leptospira sp.]|nr:hypothetical protein [Leptospira sp.]
MNPVFRIGKTYPNIQEQIQSYSRNRVPFILLGNSGSKKNEFLIQSISDLEFEYSIIDGTLFYNKDLFLDRWKEALEHKTIIILSIDRLSKEIQLILNKELIRLKSIMELPWIISTSSLELRDYVTKKYFLEELYFRIGVVTFDIAPLFERKKEILPYAEFFLENYRKEYNKRLKYFDPDLSDFLLKFNFPGDLEQLESLIQSLVITGKGRTIELKNIPKTLFQDSIIHSDRVIPIVPGIPIADYERE